MDWRNDPPKGGLPHSDIHGSKPARGYPWLFAACHVLHRLLVPRHPPNALIILRSSMCFGSHQNTSTMHGNHRQNHVVNMAHASQRECFETSGGTRGEPRSFLDRSVGSQSSRHRTRITVHSLRRTDVIRINSHKRL